MFHERSTLEALFHADDAVLYGPFTGSARQRHYVFVLRENVIQNRERLYKAFFGVFPTFDMFCQVMNSCTENYECLVLDNTCKTNRIQDMVFFLGSI
jgi:hypothetical protein